MASSDDEGETLPSVVSDYYFEDNNGEPISFSQLPLKWDDAESLHGNQKEIGLRGIIDNGLLKMFEPVTAWKYDYSYTKPEIMVLTRKNNWIKLLKPRKFFETTIRTILITVHCLNFVKRNPETPGKALWDNLAKVFSLYDPKPSEDDLVDHMNLISEAVKRDEILARSKVLVTFLEDKHRKKKAFHEEAGTTTMSSFIVDDIPDENDENGEDGSDDEGEDFFEHVCAICDNGGKILCCEGKCLRSFHATVEAGEESGCDSLGFSEEQVRAMANQNFECKNCQYKQHQCFVCGELGSSDKSAGAKVFQCVTGTCGYFYHPDCVAKVLRERIGDKAKNLESEIAAGKPFICPIHFCSHCKELEPEDKNELQTQFAICRRCPRAYHRKCLPREIAFEVDEDQGILQRAWENLMPNRILIYCLKHEIDEELATPVRDHIKFPDTDPKKKKQTLDSICKERVVSKKRGLFSDSVPKLLKTFQKSSSALRQVDFSKTNEERSFIRDSSKKLKLAENSEASLKRSFLREDKKSNVVESKASSGKHALINRDFKPVKAARGKISDTEEQTKAGRPVEKEANDSVTLDADSKRRILSIVREAESSITLDEIMKKHKAPSTHGNPSKNVTQTITLGKVEGSIEALNAALQKLEGGGSLEDAKAVCEPGLLNQIMKWKSKLKVYLAPFLYGMRYTSFGRHFTKVDKLQAIVDKLHWYVQDGDMIVDFCCGANDFSVLMKQKMDELKKRCNFKNYDIFPAKNDFNFEKRDWMTVKQNDLPSGSKLIMGLNPPFGVNAALANKFIDKALQFKPKLLILIVPQETLRLDKKRPPYDLVWEDNKLLTGKSFYLPGSVDVNDKQMEDWNVNAPPLYLWSRQDWTTKHKKIAHQQGHLPGVRKTMQLEEFHPVQLQEQGAKVTESYNEVLFYDTGDKESLKDHGCKVEANGNSEEGNKKKRKRGRGSDRKSSERQSLSGHSSPKAGGRSWDSSKHSDMAYHPEVQREGYQHVEQTSVSRSELHTERGYGGYQDVGLARSSSLNIEEPYSDIGNIWQQPVFPVPDYGFRAPDEQFVDRQRDHTNIPGHNAHFGERNEGYGRKADMRALAPFYGHQDPNYRDNYMPTPGLSSSYWQLGPTVDSEYNGMSTSAMQRYAPRLDELNPRMNNMGQLGGIGGMYNTAPGPGSGPLGFSRGPVQQLDGRGGMYNTASGPGPDPSGFAPGPKRPFSQQSSSGWLNE